MLFLEHSGLTDAGKVRQNNEDALLIAEGRDPTLFVVADGIGGFEAGEVASSMAIEALGELGPGEDFEAAIREANRRILVAAREDGRLSGMGTTIVALRFAGTQEEPTAEIAHVGDSRAYLLRGGELRPVTEDHSLVAELVRSGDLTRAQAAEHPQKNLITRALGAEEKIEADTTVLSVEVGDRFLLCSDGLSDMVPEDGISAILADSPEDPEPAARRLLSAALDAGGTDNVTVVVADVKRYEEAEGAADRSGGTTELWDVAPGEAPGEEPVRPDDATGGATQGPQRERKKGARRTPKRSSERRGKRSGRARGRARRALARLARALAVVLVAVAALTPAYLWANSRYFLGYDGGEVVLYRGLPYTVAGVELNREWERTNLEKSEIGEPYRDQVKDHRLYTRDRAEEVLRAWGGS